MLFAFYLIDRPAAADLRKEVRPRHVAYLAAVADSIAFAGPLLSDDLQSSLGSLLVVDFPDREAAERWVAGEPFTAAGIYANCTVHPFNNLWPQKVGFPES
ncbi:YciI family protein [Sphingomonas ginsenosidivorax]|uniref:YciI family protein n=1 Tax=Sphingomonas ginsenosidivorax TaxID=862135 RepID=A0A5C6U816_9SPHN|nr:YciI family protein [Sphingomonas ginsenosidivorax]TXC67976.1 YciI family protein [Sphingomonas ginsenosidivorax]